MTYIFAKTLSVIFWLANLLHYEIKAGACAEYDYITIGFSKGNKYHYTMLCGERFNKEAQE